MTTSVLAPAVIPHPDDCWWLALSAVSGIGWKTYADLLDRYGSPEAALRALADGTAKAPRVDHASAAVICANIETYRATVQWCADLHISIVRCTDAAYPQNLAALAQQKPPAPRPPFLYMKGQYQESDRRCAALVGSLTPSPDGVKRARRLAKLLVENGLTVVSGLARGIDTASHTGALEVGGRTLAVVGTGLDTVYPPENADLAAQIEGQGAIFSQFALGVGPQKHTFPMRNQVMSGMAIATIIVEGHAKCGSLIQADFAFQQGRQVYLLRSNLDQPDNAWAKELEQRGAVVVHKIEDILSTIRSPLAPGHSAQKPLLGQPPGSPSQPAPLIVKAVEDSAASTVAVLFDLEGTLYDAAAVMTEAYRHVLRESYNINVSPEAVFPLLAGSPYVLLGKWLPKGEVKAANRLYDQIYPTYLERCGRIFKDVDQTIEHLRSLGYRTGIVTSQTRRRTTKVLAALPALAQLAEVLVTWDDVVGKIKPDPYPIRLAVTKLNLKPTAVYYVGDSPSDMQAGHNAGAKTVAVSWGLTPLDVLAGQKPDYIIRAMIELPSILAARQTVLPSLD